ncbi:hypothetical protein DQ04_08921010 [Trypanosoma grayi]|uniref:hypothetical protein n=1 Tax=Trypanosoma grayi TaxID=71804 RepID=UPI0004F4AADD|nr:hypothetical protein DQ04_08921010 [Trypanosoma grayi]KEG07744.1 hypothetical protein DQ04_08921010 [Trypanosoma grayi]
MDASQRLREAVVMQVDWVPVLVARRGRPYTTWRRRQAICFAVMHFCFALVLFGHFVHNIVTWVLAFLLQTAALSISLFHIAFVVDYEEKMSNAMELEQMLNPLIIAELSIRVFALLDYLLVGGWIMCVISSVELVYDYWAFRSGDLLVDATTAWKKLDALKAGARVRVAYQVIMVIAAILYFVLSLVYE